MWEHLVKSVKRATPHESPDIHPVHKPTEASTGHEVRLHEESSHPGQEVASVSHNPKRILDCPVCHVPMQIERIGGVEIDKCPKCAGIFLDKGELAMLSQSSVELHGSSTTEKDLLLYTPHGLSSHVKGHQAKAPDS